MEIHPNSSGSESRDAVVSRSGCRDSWSWTEILSTLPCSARAFPAVGPAINTSPSLPLSTFLSQCIAPQTPLLFSVPPTVASPNPTMCTLFTQLTQPPTSNTGHRAVHQLVEKLPEDWRVIVIERNTFV